MNWLKKIFGRSEARALRGDVNSGDMRENPVDNPFDLRPDGSIREGDPAWAMMMQSLETGNPVIGNQRPDGTWDVQEIKDDPSND